MSRHHLKLVLTRVALLPIQALGRLRVEQARRLTGLIGPLLMRLISRRRAGIS
jgi:hypothetical protein